MTITTDESLPMVVGAIHDRIDAALAETTRILHDSESTDAALQRVSGEPGLDRHR